MKRILLFTMMLMCCFAIAQAQQATILDVNKTSTVNVIIDFSKASIHNMTESEFAEYEEDFYKDMPELKSKLIHDFNRAKNVDFVIGSFPSAVYTLKIEILYVGLKGDIMSNSTIVDSEGNVIAEVKDLYAKGGHIGTKLNLIGDGMYRTGKLLSRSLGSIIMEQEEILSQCQRI